MSKPKIPTLQPRVQPMKATTIATARLSGERERRSVYDSRRWRERVRPDKLRRDPICQRCRLLGLTVPATQVDHWTRFTHGGDAWDEANLVSLCDPHHDEKSKAERAGLPLFEIAPSNTASFGWLT